MRRLLLILISTLSVLAACATQAIEPEKDASIGADATIDIASDGSQNSLAAQTLQPNECGLFMWSKTDPSRFVFFNKAGSSNALFLMDDMPTEMTITSAGGDIFGQFFTDTTYETQGGRSVSVSYQAGENIDDGARISSGVIQFLDTKDWLTTLPIVGVRFCQPLPSENNAGTNQPRPQ